MDRARERRTEVHEAASRETVREAQVPTARGRCAVWAGACGAGLATEPRRTLLLLCCH